MNFSTNNNKNSNGVFSTEGSNLELTLSGVLQSAKKIVNKFTVGTGINATTLDATRGMSTNYIIRGMTTTSYATEVVLEQKQNGLHYLKTEGANANIKMSGSGEQGQELYLKITNDSTANRVITFGTNFSVTGTLTGSTSASAILHFISDGMKFWEVSRTTGLT